MLPRSIEHPVRVRFAPSPSGAVHLGSALVAVANAAFARANGGTLVLRIDDTDQSRSRESDAQEIERLLRWLGVAWDEGPVRQQDRGTHYAAAMARLDATGDAYPCFCGVARLAELREQQLKAGQPPRYDGRCRSLPADERERSRAAGAPHVVRLQVPVDRDVEFDDLVHGRTVVPAGSFGDPVLTRADGSPGYLLASVVDDIELGITHVIRGEDHLTNTARQLLLFEALDASAIPAFAHLPLLRDDDGRKLSKRDPLGTLDELVDEGFLPVTVRRYLSELLGQGAVDVLPPDGAAMPFVLDRVPTGAPRVDRTRLESLGRDDMAQLGVDELLEGTGVDATTINEPLVLELAASAPSRVALRGELRLVFDGPGPGDLPLVLAITTPDAASLAAADRALALVVDLLRLELDAGMATGHDTIWAVPFLARLREAGREQRLGPRDLLRPLRVALTGTSGGPALDLILTAIGARDALRRVHIARIVIEELQQGGNDALGG